MHTIRIYITIYDFNSNRKYTSSGVVNTEQGSLELRDLVQSRPVGNLASSP